MGWVVLAALIAIILVLVVFPKALPDSMEPFGVDDDLLLLSYWTTIGNGALFAVLALAAWLRHWSVRDYFGLVRPSYRKIGISLAVLGMLLAAESMVIYLTDWNAKYAMEEPYLHARTAGAQSLLWLTFDVIATLVAAEMTFWGFLYRGWARTQRGVVPAILVISALPLVPDSFPIQDDWFAVFFAYCFGLICGWARWWSGSTLLAILLYVVAHLWSMATIVVNAEWPS